MSLPSRKPQVISETATGQGCICGRHDGCGAAIRRCGAEGCFWGRPAVLRSWLLGSRIAENINDVGSDAHEQTHYTTA